ncbi:MAG: hypothetical protein ACKVJD_00780 [Burkholderiales bacterium]|nr:hypothetical protein MOLA814_01568 [Betaproteobacteria bacterium MOLA814]
MSTSFQTTSNRHHKHLFVLLARVMSVLAFAALLSACVSPLGRVGVSVPIGGFSGFGGVRIGVDTNGTVSGSVAVGESKGGVSVRASSSGSSQIAK